MTQEKKYVYLTGGYHGEMIQKIEVIKETLKQLVILEKRYNGKSYERKVFKESPNHRYHESWEDAHEYLIAKVNNDIESYKRHLENCYQELEKIKQMKEGQ